MIKPPKRPETHRIGDVGQSIVALQFKKWGWTADIISSDYGEDISSEIYINERRTAFHFRCQVKSTSSNKGQIRELKSKKYSVSIDSSTCVSWALSYYPIILAIYNDVDGEIYWTNATEQVRKKITGLSKNSLTIHITKVKLNSSKKELEKTITNFYSQLLTISEPEYKCEIYPILMPSHRALPMDTLMSGIYDSDKFKISLEFIQYQFDELPSWTTSIRSLEGSYLKGWCARANYKDLEDYLFNLQKRILDLDIQYKENEWLAFICSPIYLTGKSSKNDQDNSLWNKKITDWWCYSVINNAYYSDSDYSFKIPNEFLSQIARHSRSWDGYWRVNSKLDWAVEIFSGSPTTPAYREQQNIHKEQTKGQFVAWECKPNEINALQNILTKIDLSFRAIEENLINTDDDYISGIICDPMFSPEVGLIAPTNKWDEFDIGKVNYRLNSSKLLDTLPGRKGSDQISKFILSFFNWTTNDKPKEIMVSQQDYTIGLPLNHENRILSFQRFRLCESIIKENFDKYYQTSKEKLLKLITNDCMSFDARIENIEIFNEVIIQVSVIIEPIPNISTYDFILKYQKEITTFFNSIYPKKVNSSSKTNKNTTLEILKLYGELYFEGDEPWGKLINKNS